jgi:6-phosphogluconate dehydrogenase
MSDKIATTVSSAAEDAVPEQAKSTENVGDSRDSPVSWDKVKVSEILDSVSKATVAGLVVIYACGFVIISISNAEYGFTEVNPLRAKILERVRCLSF